MEASVCVDAVTVKPSPPETPPLVAVTRAVPAPTALMTPVAETVTTDELFVE